MYFDELDLNDNVLDALYDMRFDTCTPVQEKCIPEILEGHDVLGVAQTGTGKTAAYLLPVLSKLDDGGYPKDAINCVIMSPTRELAQQIDQAMQGFGYYLQGVSSVAVYGGNDGNRYDQELRSLRMGADVVIATPGRLISHISLGNVDLSKVSFFILDEADRMLDMGFWPAMRKIIGATPQNRQTLLFSATIDRTIMNTAGKLLHDPAMVEIAHKGETADTVEQYVMHVQQAVKPELLKGLMKERGHRRVIVFCRTRSRADATCRRLKKVGYSVEAIHSSRSQNQRRRALENFANGTTDVLVATDVLARGIDVEEVEYVVNYDLPTQPEDYVHRIGRTGRAGASGFAVSFVSPETADALRVIQKLLKRTIPELELENFDMHEAENEAAARAQRAEARRDPEIQQAKKEQAARTRRKNKAREAAQAEEVSTRRAKRGGRKAAEKPASGTAHAARKHSNADHGSQQKRGNGSRNASANRAKTSNASGAQGGDFRPGRAHRAQVAHQRNRRR